MLRVVRRCLKVSAWALGLWLIFVCCISVSAVKVHAERISIKVGGANVGVSAGESGEAEESGSGETEASADEVNEAPEDGEIPLPSYKSSSSDKKYTMDLTSRIPDGVFAGPVDLSGKNYFEAENAISEYVQGLKAAKLTFVMQNNATETVSAGDFGLDWRNHDLINEAVSLGKSGNIVARYKLLKDIENEKKIYDIALSCDRSRINEIIGAWGDKYNIPPVSPRVRHENGAFIVLQEGSTGYEINKEASIEKIVSELESFDGSDKTIELTVEVTEARGTEEDFELMTDVLGTFHTSFSSSSADRSGNVRNGTKLINGTMLYPGDQFSVYQTVSPFTEENGYFLAGSYMNGLVVESLGGGICQVSSTLYNAVLRAELQVDERYNHSMIVTYVDLSSDAAIAGTSKDFKFTNNLDNPIYIEGYTTDSKEVYFTIYGVETRPANRTVEFQSVEISKTEPEGVNIVADNSQPVGYMSSQSAHTGYSGELWKIVKVDGVETERVQINKSNYKMTPRTVTVGTKADDAAISEMVRAAIASGDLDTVKGTISNLQAAANGEAVALPVLPAEPSAEEQAAAAEAYAQALAEMAATQEALAQQAPPPQEEQAPQPQEEQAPPPAEQVPEGQ
ncbi:MAG: VanW family protein [Lachnospiraceae bacterium]|nr:VanW family protein [Lachnospiraceae bacterium]